VAKVGAAIKGIIGILLGLCSFVIVIAGLAFVGWNAFQVGSVIYSMLTSGMTVPVDTLNTAIQCANYMIFGAFGVAIVALLPELVGRALCGSAAKNGFAPKLCKAGANLCVASITVSGMMFMVGMFVFAFALPFFSNAGAEIKFF
jgi:hypothetical protein